MKNILGKEECLELLNKEGKKIYKFSINNSGLFEEKTFDSNGELLTHKCSDGFTAKYTYDKFGMIATIRGNDGIVKGFDNPEYTMEELEKKYDMESLNVVVLEAGKTEGYIQSYPKESITLIDMQDLVGGYIKTIALNENQFMVINKNGKKLRLPINKMANAVLVENNPSFAKLNTIVGNVFIIEMNDFD